MRHRKSFNHLGKKPAHRKAMLSNMAASLIINKRITTTTAKAKALRSFVEPLLTKAKDDTTHSRRVVFSYLGDKNAVTELFREVSAKITDRPGGYTRILKIGNRPGDNADMAIIELVDFNETLVTEKSTSKTASKRRRRGSGAKKTAPAAPAAESMVEDAKVIEESTAEVETPADEPVNESPADPVEDSNEEDTKEKES